MRDSYLTSRVEKAAGGRGRKRRIVAFAAECADERSLAERGPGDGVDALDPDSDIIGSRLLERGAHGGRHVGVYDPFGWLCQQDQEPIGLLDHLPRCDRDRFQRRVEDVGMDRHPLQVEDILFPPFDGVEERERSTVRAGLHGGSDAISELVADEWLGPREEHRHEELGAEFARRDRPVLLIDDLGDDEVFVTVEPVVLALGRDPRGLGRGIDVEWLDPERRPDSSARLVGENLGRAHDRPGRDSEPSGELLVGEGSEDGCVPDE